VSNLETDPAEAVCGGAVAVAPAHELLPGREVVIGPRNLLVNRTLPNRGRRMVGAWCFFDHFGPDDTTAGDGMRVAPHPHTGLQTVTWLVDGEVLHRDSIGSEQLIRPGQLNVMTAGHGIAHSEESPALRSPILHGVQLWVALPGGGVRAAPAFDHHAELPVLDVDGVTVRVMTGDLGGTASPARAYSPLVGAELTLRPDAVATLPLRPDFEYAVQTLSGVATVDGVVLEPGALLYLGSDRTALPVSATEPARVLLLGGEPFAEEIVMWWNFVARSHDEIVAARDEWMAGADRFGAVHGYAGDRLPAPPLPGTRLKPRGRTR